MCYLQKIKVNLINVRWVMSVKKKNFKTWNKKISFKNITLIYEIETNLERGKNVYLLSKVKRKLLMNNLRG